MRNVSSPFDPVTGSLFWKPFSTIGSERARARGEKIIEQEVDRVGSPGLEWNAELFFWRFGRA